MQLTIYKYTLNEKHECARKKGLDSIKTALTDAVLPCSFPCFIIAFTLRRRESFMSKLYMSMQSQH
jgi:hypothetical protein